MPQYKDEKRKSWYVKLYYQDWTGQRRQKLKRGFLTKRDASTWEREFLEQQQGASDISFKSLVMLYLEDVKPRIKESSFEMKEGVIDMWVLPYFAETPILSLTAAHIRKWHTVLLSHRTAQGEPFSDTCLRNIDRQLVAILNYGVKFHGLSKNPHELTGYIGKPFANRVDFWTLETFNHFMEAGTDESQRIVFKVLYYTGARCGEMLALTPKDIDLIQGIIHINKTYVHLKGRTVTTSPKTANSVRSIPIPSFLRDDLREYMSHIYGLEHDTCIFPYSDDCIYRWMSKVCVKAGLPHMRVHALRHSHVSLLINMGFPPLLIAERIGDNVEMVNRIYGHLYPNKHTEVAEQLQQLVSN